MSPTPSPRAAFVTIALRTPDPARAERAAAEAYEAGAVGLEERSGTDGLTWVLYAPESAAEAILAVLAHQDVAVASPEPVPALDWSEHWKRHHRPVVVSERLCVHPSFAPVPARAEQRVLVIDPGAAFGTGSHESTRLVLEWIDVLAPSLPANGRLLDIGTGTGVLALAALSLAPVRALGLDLDPLATHAARANARRNHLDDRLAIFTGGLSALHPQLRFEAIVANLLRSELEPLLPEIARRARPDAPIVLAGLLERERERVESLAADCGLETTGLRSREDAGGEIWIGLLMRRRRAGANPR